MRKRAWLIAIIVVAFFVLVAAGAYVGAGGLETTLEFRMVDAVSGSWVWDATIQLQNRVIRSFFQTDQGPKDFTFTSLRPGSAEIRIEAPGYQSQTVPVRLRRGGNTLPEPIEMLGLEIPNLARFVVIDDMESGRLTFEIRPVGEDGKAVLNHPCLDIWFGVLISEQLKGGSYVQSPQDEGSERGAPLFAGKVPWEWDGAPETSFRYSASLPLRQLPDSPASYWVIDTLVVVPDPLAISGEELDRILERVYTFQSPEEVVEYLEQYTDRLTYYFPPTSWNVEAGT